MSENQKISTDGFLGDFKYYIDEGNRLFSELNDIPWWRFIKAERKLREIRALTTWFENVARQRGIDI